MLFFSNNTLENYGNIVMGRESYYNKNPAVKEVQYELKKADDNYIKDKSTIVNIPRR
jgi:hypothetical protein